MKASTLESLMKFSGCTCLTIVVGCTCITMKTHSYLTVSVCSVSDSTSSNFSHNTGLQADLKLITKLTLLDAESRLTRNNMQFSYFNVII